MLQVLQASVTGLEPKSRYILALAAKPDGKGELQPLSTFMTNPAGSAVVNALGSIREIVQNDKADLRRYLVIAAAGEQGPGEVVQTQAN